MERNDVDLEIFTSIPHWLVGGLEEAFFSSSRSNLLRPLNHEHSLFPNLSFSQLTQLVSFLMLIRTHSRNDLYQVSLPLRELRSLFSQSQKRGRPSRSKTPLAIENSFGYDGLFGKLQLIIRSGSDIKHPFFNQENWNVSENEAKSCIELTLGDVGIELVWGIFNPIRELLDKLNSRVGLRSLNSTSPLYVNKSTFWELKQVELLMYLRLMKSVQWEDGLIDMQGNCQISKLQLTSGLEIPSYKKIQHLPAVFKNLHYINKLFQKLVDQGVSRHSEVLKLHPQLMPVSPESYIIWASKEFSEYAQLSQSCGGKSKSAVSYLIKYFIKGFFQMFQKLAGTRQEELKSESTMLFQFLDSISTQESEWDFFYDQRQNLLIPFVCLYIEWAIRQKLTGPFSLPENLIKSTVGEVLKFSSVSELHSNFKRFSKIISAHSVFEKLVFDYPGYSLFSLVTQKQVKPVKEVIPDFSTNKLGLPKESITSAEKLSFSKTASVNLPTANSDDYRQRIPETSHPKDPPETVVAQVTEIKIDNARLTRIAEQELEKIAFQNPEEFRELKSKYFHSLDEPSKKAIVSIRNKMDSVLFERHLKKRLVSFMVENPSVWSSVGRIGSQQSLSRSQSPIH